MKTLSAILPLVLHAAALSICWTLGGRVFSGGWLLSVLLYPVVLPVLAGAAAWVVRGGVRAGRFLRDPRERIYRARMIYGAAWTTVYYCKPVLHVLLAYAPLRRLVFRLFGYRGSLDFTIYPDCWIRDLCLLNFGAGTYIANRATLGTNHVRADGKIEVAAIETGERVIVGHLAMVGGGTRIGAESEIGVAAKVGFKVRLGIGVAVGPEAVVDSRSRIGDRVTIGARAYVGKACVIADGVSIPAGAVLPDRTVVQSDGERLRVAA